MMVINNKINKKNLIKYFLVISSIFFTSSLTLAATPSINNCHSLADTQWQGIFKQKAEDGALIDYPVSITFGTAKDPWYSVGNTQISDIALKQLTINGKTYEQIDPYFACELKETETPTQILYATIYNAPGLLPNKLAQLSLVLSLDADKQTTRLVIKPQESYLLDIDKVYNPTPNLTGSLALKEPAADSPDK
jgi:hypothetical protein